MPSHIHSRTLGILGVGVTDVVMLEIRSRSKVYPPSLYMQLRPHSQSALGRWDELDAHKQ